MVPLSGPEKCKWADVFLFFYVVLLVFGDVYLISAGVEKVLADNSLKFCKGIEPDNV